MLRGWTTLRTKNGPGPGEGGLLAPAALQLPPIGTAMLFGTVLLFTLLLWLISNLEPLFFSNQNTKFLHGLADAGYGQLAEDWMAQTVDGLPVFTRIVQWTAKVGPFWLFYVEQFLVYAVHALALVLLFRRAHPWATGADRLPLLLFVLVFASLHVNHDLASGVANQLIIKSIYEPANFGAFALLGLAAFLAGRHFLAVLLINVAGAVHAGYVAPGGFLLLGMAACLPIVERAQRRNLALALALALGFAGLALNALLLKLAFPATTPALQAQATALLANERIPQHTDPTVWLNLEAMLKLALCAAAVVLTRNRLIRRVLAVGLGAILLSALFVVLFQADFIRLVSPWRVSVFLVPLAWVVVLGWLIEQLLPWFRRRGLVRWGVAGIVATAFAFAVYGGWSKIEKFSRPPPPYAALVEANLAPGQVYLTSPGLSGFRLRTGAPQYVSTKTHPYLDVEVLEWHRRLEIAEALFDSETLDCAAVSRLRDEEGVTHLLTVEKDPTFDCPFAVELGSDRGARLYRLDGAS